MKQLKFLVLFCLLPFLGQIRLDAQVKILVIKDSEDTFGNTAYLASALDSLQVPYTYYDCSITGQPSLDLLNAQNLVIWHTSTWGQNLHLWEQTDQDNAALKAYLSKPSANLWLIGNDFLFDRYASPPVTFAAGTFPFDYLGITNYKAQSYGDDGNLGVPFVKPAAPNPIANLGNVNWQFSTLWWADQCEIRPEATPVYLFGGTGYPLSNGITGWYFPRPNSSKVLTFAFDLSLAGEFSAMKQTVKAVLDWWRPKITAVSELNTVAAAVEVFPTVVSDFFTVQFKEPTFGQVQIQLFDQRGIAVAQQTKLLVDGYRATVNIANSLTAGVYYCKITTVSGTVTRKLIKQ